MALRFFIFFLASFFTIALFHRYINNMRRNIHKLQRYITIYRAIQLHVRYDEFGFSGRFFFLSFTFTVIIIANQISLRSTICERERSLCSYEYGFK